MGSGRYFTFITVLSFGAFLLLQSFAGCKELHREVACYKDILRIDCGRVSFIAIHEAYFTTQVQENQTCHLSTLEQEHDYTEDEAPVTKPTNASGCYEDIRVSINRKCSGSKSCNYSYFEEPDKNCPNQRGSFTVKYDCVKNSSAINYCNVKVHEREGYIASPGFPQFYPQLDNCNWTVEASDGQTIFAKVLHLHLRAPTEHFPTVADPDMYAMGMFGQLVAEPLIRCDDDALTILEGNVKRAVLCGESSQSLKKIEAEAQNGMMVKFKSSAFLPASGFLMYFKIQGCPNMPPSEGSYVVERNGSAAVYACQSNEVFEDTLENLRYLSCVRDHHWNDTLPPCTPLEVTTTTVATSEKSTDIEMENMTVPATENADAIVEKEAAFLEDILIPCVLIGVLIIGNAIIVTIIICLRRRQKNKTEEEDANLNQPSSQPLVSEAKDV